MKIILLALLALSSVEVHAVVRAKAVSFLPKGNAAWVYDVNRPGAPQAMWADYLGFYNSNTLAPHNIPTVYSYGGDMEILSGVPTTSFPAKNQAAAQAYKKVYGVKNVILTIDGQMDGGAAYSPDLSKLGVPQIQAWADRTANQYCAFSYVDGVQLDLEPARAPYVANLLVFIKQLSQDLQKGNCVDATHPQGRTVGVFMGAGAATASVFSSLGANGYVIVSGYDLSDSPAGTVTDPVKYAAQIAANVKLIAATAAPLKGSFVIGIPGAASVHEFSQYITATNAVFGFPMYHATKPSYVVGAINAIKPYLGNSGYLGTALWGFTLEMANPVNSRNMFYPSNPFQQAGELNYFQANL